MRPLISLCMMVKDEAASLTKVLEAVKPFIDRWTILDTGSTDNTTDIVKEALGDVPGQLHREPFTNYADTRNRVLQLDFEREGAPAVFQLVLSGDEYLREGAKLREHLESHRNTNVDCHFIQLAIDNVRFFTPRVLRIGSNWKYEGIVHEVPMNHIDKDPPIANAHGVYIEHIISDYERRYSNIWEKHIPLLREALEKNPNDERALIFLAQSYESLFFGMEPDERVEYAKEAVELYTRRLAIPTGNQVERNYVRMHRLDTAQLTGEFTTEELLAEAVELVQDDPKRPETAMLLAQLSAKLVPLTQVYNLYKNAAYVAAEAFSIDNSSPVDTSICWRAHHSAAVCAKQLAAKHPEYEPLMREHVKAGLEAGGPWDRFRAVLPHAEKASEPDATASV